MIYLKAMRKNWCAFYLIFSFACFSEAQPVIKLKQKVFNTDTIPLQNDAGRKRVIVKVLLQNIGNKPLIIKCVTTVNDNYHYVSGDEIIPKQPIQSGKCDTVFITHNFDDYNNE